MPRKARVVAVGVPHHIVARGNNRQDVFLDPRDRDIYLKNLQKHAKRRGLRIWGYCLMTNHVHLVAVPETETSLALTIGCAHSDYSRFLNTAYGRCGHLWQARYYSSPMDTLHAFRALAYVESNPVRAGVVDKAWSYCWSSAAEHCTAARGKIDLADHEWRMSYTPERWRSVLASGVSDEAFAERLRAATRVGLALGASPFVDALGRQVGRDLRHKPAGRPRKQLAVGA